jgi:NADH-quinone oxidoreductase subunit C/D
MTRQPEGQPPLQQAQDSAQAVNSTSVPAEPTPENVAKHLNSVFPGSTRLGERNDLIVEADQWLQVARYLQGTEGLAYDFLASVTGIDFPDYFEVAYSLFSTQHYDDGLTVKARAAKGDPVVPSVVSVWAGADFQEREIWDLFGVRFAGHPNLRRILMWEGFEGHPLRKDYLEAYYEQDHKPFDSRWPDGWHERAEERQRWGRNVVYPRGYAADDLDRYQLPGEGLLVVQPGQVAGGAGDIEAERIMLNMGPQHPSTHGVFQMKVLLEGETIVDLEPVMGYLHRNHEQIGERNLWLGNMPYTDRLDYICSMSNNLSYAVAVERMMGTEVPEYAEYLRILMVELTRIVNHMWAIGFLLNDLGAFFTPALYAIEEREIILDLFEMTAGSRMMCNYMRFGGVAYDLPPEAWPMLDNLIHNRIPRAIDELDDYLTQNEILIERCRGVGILPAELAINYSASGPVLRGSGVAYDVRRAQPYSIYDRFDFDVASRPNGDVYDRYLVRIDEMRQSHRILEQALEQMPRSGEILSGRKAWQTRVPEGEIYSRIDNPKGELGFYLVSDGGANPYRYHVRSPSFINITGLGEMCKGHKIADVVAILGSIDIVLGELDR